MNRPAHARLRTWGLAGCALALVAWTWAHHPAVSVALVLASLILFAMAGAASRHLMPRSVAVCAVVAVAVGWAAEQAGTSFGWLFGRYTYTDVLGPRVVDVPVAIPLMWFALAMVGWSMARLLLWRHPLEPGTRWPGSLLTAWLAAMLVTAFDLGADPYFVYVLKAWIMEKPDGGWFGETVEGFVGWMAVSFVITLFIDRTFLRHAPQATRTPGQTRAFAVLLAIYGAALVFQLIWGANLALRVVTFFAMGIPLLLAWTRWWQWRQAPVETAA
ncbi:MAG: carotenoid biosynthesis protein [Burkholderiaceae bacterium]